MPLFLDLPPEIEAWIAKEAEHRGVAPQAFVVSVLTASFQTDVPASPRPPHSEAEFQEFLNRISAHSENLPVLSEYALSRESMYEDHD